MDKIRFFRDQCLQINENNFDEIALEIFRYQASENPLYRAWLDRLGSDLGRIKSLEEIPFLPIRFFKSQLVLTGSVSVEKIFRSSGTTGAQTSSHAVDSIDFYHEHALSEFRLQLMDPAGVHFLAVLPSYTERADSSLISMAECLIRTSGSKFSGFYSPHVKSLMPVLKDCRATGKPVILLGVTFALLQFAREGLDLSGVNIIETGGMKGRGRELTREELHQILKPLNPRSIWSEYGMTELLSQAYSLDGAPFKPSKSMKVLIREINDPFQASEQGKTGILKIIDLANVHSCCFIETQDLGKLHPDGRFEVIGRQDFSDVRGCNLLFEGSSGL